MKDSEFKNVLVWFKQIVSLTATKQRQKKKEKAKEQNEEELQNEASVSVDGFSEADLSAASEKTEYSIKWYKKEAFVFRIFLFIVSNKNKHSLSN
jgi:hypothetical protein